MSASTVSITGNQGPITRRRAVEKNISAGGSDLAAAAVAVAVTESENKDARDTAATLLRDVRKTPAQIQSKKSGPARKTTKPRWSTLVSILTKNLALLVVLLGFMQMIRYLVMNSGPDADDFSVISGDFEGKFSEVEKFVKITMKAMQVQVDAIDRKLEDGISSVRKEFDEKMEKKGDETDLKLKALDVRSDVIEKFMDGFRSKSLLSKEDFSEFFEDFKKARKNGGGDVSIDDIRDFAKQIVEKEIERHAADGLGMVDYALASGGGKVLRHSEPYGGMRGIWLSWKKVSTSESESESESGSGILFNPNKVSTSESGSGILFNRNKVSTESEKMIRPSFGEPGQCFPLKGSSGFIEIRLRAAIVPEAVTLEHVAKSVAYDRSSAPKHCRVSGWMQSPDSTVIETGTKKMYLLTEFVYDLEKSNVQTFKVESAASNRVNTVRFDFTSNHGSASHTCIYRLRVHGHEPSPVPKMD